MIRFRGRIRTQPGLSFGRKRSRYGDVWHNPIKAMKRAGMSWRAGPKELAIKVTVDRGIAGYYNARACVRKQGSAGKRCSELVQGKTPTVAAKLALRELAGKL